MSFAHAAVRRLRHPTIAAADIMSRRFRQDRGDVPGWVLVTIMTAGLVAALWAVAGDMLTDAFAAAIQETVGQP